MIGITTKYHGWTNTRAAYLSATVASGVKVRLSLSDIPGDADSEEMHKLVAEKLCKKMNWPGELVGGGTKEGMVFCFVPQEFIDRKIQEYLTSSMNSLLDQSSEQSPEAKLDTTP